MVGWQIVPVLPKLKRISPTNLVIYSSSNILSQVSHLLLGFTKVEASCIDHISLSLSSFLTTRSKTRFQNLDKI